MEKRVEAIDIPEGPFHLCLFQRLFFWWHNCWIEGLCLARLFMNRLLNQREGQGEVKEGK